MQFSNKDITSQIKFQFPCRLNGGAHRRECTVTPGGLCTAVWCCP